MPHRESGPRAASSRRPRPGRPATRGIALVWSLFILVVVAGVILSGTESYLATERVASAEFVADGQARAVAEAGLVDAFAWFRRQQVQPVLTFAPQRDLAASPSINETDDPAVGLLRDYEILPGLWARYEVRRPTAAEAFTDQDADGRYDFGEPFTDTDGDGERDPARNTRDVSLERGQPGLGSVWRLESRGTVFRRRDQLQPLGAAGNDRLASVVVSAEIRRLVIVPPAVAAVCVRQASAVTIGARTRIMGGSKGGVISLTGTGSHVLSGSPEITGSPARGTAPSWNDTPEGMFGVGMAELQGMADASHETEATFPARIGDYTLNIVPGPITFDGARPLRGTGVVIVNGDCTFSAGNNSFFNGLLYVRGNLTVRGPAYLRGTLVATGSANISGSGGDYTEIQYDGGMLSQVMTLLGQYRWSSATREVSPVLPDGTPDEEGLVRLQHEGLPLPGGALPADLGSSLR